MPRDIVNPHHFSEETDEILSRIPPKFSKNLIILIVSICCFGGVILYIFQAFLRDETTYFKIYPEIKKLTTPYFSKIEKLYAMDGHQVRKGDTLLRISNLKTDSAFYMIAMENGLFLYSIDLKRGKIVEENTPVGAIFSNKSKYILLGKVLSEGDGSRNKNELSFLSEKNELINGNLESRDKEDGNVYSILPTKSMLRKSIAIDSLSFRKRNKSLKSVLMTLDNLF